MGLIGFDQPQLVHLLDAERGAVVVEGRAAFACQEFVLQQVVFHVADDFGLLVFGGL